MKLTVMRVSGMSIIRLNLALTLGAQGGALQYQFLGAGCRCKWGHAGANAATVRSG